jgi:histidyl-tRNA synthetase
VSKDFSPPRGTADLLPPESERMRVLVREAWGLASRYGFRAALTPSLDHTELFARTSGETSDVVTKEMYTFEDKGGRSLTLKPEGTAGVVRAYLAHRQDLPSPFKAAYVERTWRYGRPQAGRLREFRQFGVEIIGADAPDADVEVIALADDYLRGRGLERLKLLVNSIGDDACRPAYRESLLAYLESRRGDICDEHRESFERNPMRVLDCKTAECRAVAAGAPVIIDALCEPCAEHFGAVMAGLDEGGIGYELEPRLVRGLDYYTRTAFEFVSGALSEAQATVCGGGRYDGLAEVLGGEPTPGVGFGMGLDRVLIAMEEEGRTPGVPPYVSVFVIGLGEGRAIGRSLVRELRGAGLGADTTYGERPLKAQLKAADRSGAPYAAIVGDREAAGGVVTMRRLADGEQAEVPRGEVIAWIRSRD